METSHISEYLNKSLRIRLESHAISVSLPQIFKLLRVLLLVEPFRLAQSCQNLARAAKCVFYLLEGCSWLKKGST